MALTLHESYELSGTGTKLSTNGAGTFDIAQTFKSDTAHLLKKVELKLYRGVADVVDEVTVEIRATTAGAPLGTDAAYGSALGSKTVDVSAITVDTDGEWISFIFATPISLSADITYAIVVASSVYDASNCVQWRYHSSSSTYANGSFCRYNGSWTIFDTSPIQDCTFREYGGLVLADSPPAAIDYTKKLIAIGADELWYESTVGTTMSVLAASIGDIDVENSLSAIEAFQKIFIVNKTNFKVADFANTKINTSTIGSYIPHRGNTLVGGSSEAEMIVDYIDASSDEVNIYGYRTTAATFTSGETVTCTNDDDESVSFATSAAETAPPHWYDWTVYANDSTNYGTMPASSSIITLYRGRIVINDDNRPHAWYMFKIDNPWKVKYDFTNDGDLSAVTHTSTEVGEIGDILTVLISYKDDLIIFGCVNEIWILVGDPLGSGQLARITNATGIWGKDAWCIDDKGNLYFLGNDGLYRMPISESFSQPENISRLVLPNLVSDLDLDKSLHRVVLAYDPINRGIIITRTLLTTGANTGYWFDLLTQGFYPESYPNSCGIFSAFHYQATDDSYNKFLVGCADGYIREFDKSTEGDIETDDSETAIDSYFTIIGKLSEDEDTEGKMTWLRAITAGGGSNGEFSDSDNVDFSAFTGDDAETVLEDIIDGAATIDWAAGQDYVVGDLRIYNHIEYISLTIHTSVAGGGVDGYGEPDTNTTDWSAIAFTTGIWSGSGKQTKDRIRMRGCWFGLKLRNRTASETFAIDKLSADIKPAGKVR